MDPFDFIFDLILLRWLLDDDDDRSPVLKVVVVLVVLAGVVAGMGYWLKWW